MQTGKWCEICFFFALPNHCVLYSLIQHPSSSAVAQRWSLAYVGQIVMDYSTATNAFSTIFQTCVDFETDLHIYIYIYEILGWGLVINNDGKRIIKNKLQLLITQSLANEDNVINWAVYG